MGMEVDESPQHVHYPPNSLISPPPDILCGAKYKYMTREEKQIEKFRPVSQDVNAIPRRKVGTLPPDHDNFTRV